MSIRNQQAAVLGGAAEDAGSEGEGSDLEGFEEELETLLAEPAAGAQAFIISRSCFVKICFAYFIRMRSS